MTLKIFRIVLSGFLLTCALDTFAQDYAESALLFGRTKPGGSARIQAMGGAQIAIGGDYSSGGSNPAGLGMFNRSEFTISTGLTSNTATSSYLGTGASDNRTVLNIPGISLSLHWPSEKDDKFIGGTFGVSMTRVNDLNRAMIIRGNNTPGNVAEPSSIVDYFIDQAWGFNTGQFEEDEYHYNTPTGLSYHTYLIGPWSSHPTDPGSTNEYFTYVGYPGVQEEQTIIKGATNQWNFSYGGNYMDKFFFGAGVGIASLKYKSEQIFSEGNFTNPDTITSLQLNENFDIRGSGVNLSLGAIYRITNFLQIGASYTTPTFYTLTENYEASMTARWNNFDYYGDGSEILGNESASTDIVTSEYNLRTPSRFSTGVAFISRFGLLTGEIELTNPGNSKYSSQITGINFTPENDDIKSYYKSVVNYRLGGEFRYDIFRVRAGFGVQSNPYQGGLKAENKIVTLSGGVGVRMQTFYIDFALVNNRIKKNFYQPYSLEIAPPPVAEMKYNRVTGMITAGFTF